MIYFFKWAVIKSFGAEIRLTSDGLHRSDAERSIYLTACRVVRSTSCSHYLNQLHAAAADHSRPKSISLNSLAFNFARSSTVACSAPAVAAMQSVWCQPNRENYSGRTKYPRKQAPRGRKHIRHFCVRSRGGQTEIVSSVVSARDPAVGAEAIKDPGKTWWSRIDEGKWLLNFIIEIC